MGFDVQDQRKIRNPFASNRHRGLRFPVMTVPLENPDLYKRMGIILLS